MIPVASFEARLFLELGDLREFLGSWERGVYEASVSDAKLEQDGTMRAGRFAGQATEPALRGLLRVFKIPEPYGLEVCPPDLLVYTVGRLAAAEQNGKVIRIQTVDGVATAIMPADRLPIRHEDLLDWLQLKTPIKQAVLEADYLRITALTKDTKELLPGDNFGYGWEVRNSESGWLPTEAWRYVMKLECSNGMVGFDRTASYSRSPTSKQPVLASLEMLAQVLKDGMELPELHHGIRWASERRLGKDLEPVKRHLAHMLEGHATRLALAEIGEGSSWYELLNTLTYQAHDRPLARQRSYEVEGGRLLSWFLREGRSRPPWVGTSCPDCMMWDN